MIWVQGCTTATWAAFIPAGSDTRPAPHESQGLAVATQVRPLDFLGQPDDVDGHIGLVAIGMSLTNQEFEVFEFAANVDPRRNPRVTMINGAQGGQSAFQWADPNNVVWSELARIVANKGLSTAQVQVAWIKMTVRGSDVGGWDSFPPFPATAAISQLKLKDIVRNLKHYYPNVRIAYLSSRIYGDYAPDGQYPEPVAYEEGFGVKWLIEDQINGDPLLTFTGATPQAPFLSWGPYLWADGLGADGVPGGVPGRRDGMEYACDDYSDDGLHPSPTGRRKVADQLVSFFNQDSTSQFWYVNPSPPPVAGTPYYLDLDGVDDFVDVPDSQFLSFGNGTADTPLTFELWFRPDTMAGKQNLISKWGDAPNIEYRLYISSGSTIRLDLYDGSSGATVSAYAAINLAWLVGGWHHVAAVYDGRGGPNAAGGIALYVDGAALPLARNNNPAYVAMENRTAPLQIGRESSRWKQYDGALDELRVWNVTRTATQLQTYMTTELSGAEPGLVAYWRFNEGAGALITDDSSLDHTATTFNSPSWQSGGAMAPPAPDVIPPEISNVSISGITDTGAQVSFTTNERTTGWVSYTQSTSCPCSDAYSQSPGTTSHAIQLTGLTPDRAYLVEAKAVDSAANFQVAPSISFRTFATPPDVVPPVVSILRPAAGVVSGPIVLEAAASDNIGVSSVRFTLDGISLGDAIVTPPYSIPWDSSATSDGPHTIAAEARDEENNATVASVSVYVANSPVTSTPYFLDFDGVDDYVDVADNDDLSFGNGVTDTPFTFELWLRPDTMTGKQNLISKWGDAPNLEYKLYISSGNTIRLDLHDGSSGATVSAYASSSLASLIGGWHHLAVVYDGRGGPGAANGISFYLDGSPLSLSRHTNSSYVAMENRTPRLQIGRESTRWKQYNGALDDIRLWSTALTQEQILRQMTVELGGLEFALLAYWKLNEGAGTALEDESAFNHAASMINNPTWISGGPLTR